MASSKERNAATFRKEMSYKELELSDLIPEPSAEKDKLNNDKKEILETQIKLAQKSEKINVLLEKAESKLAQLPESKQETRTDL